MVNLVKAKAMIRKIHKQALKSYIVYVSIFQQPLLIGLETRLSEQKLKIIYKFSDLPIVLTTLGRYYSYYY